MSEVIRGLSVGANASKPEANVFNISGRTDLAVAALGSLGLVADRSAAGWRE